LRCHSTVDQRELMDENRRKAVVFDKRIQTEPEQNAAQGGL